MAEKVLEKTDTGKALVSTFSESAEERDERIRDSALEADKVYTLTKGQARTLARARRVARRGR